MYLCCFTHSLYILRALERLISRAIEQSGIRTVERQTELHNNEHGKIRKNVKLT
jgi:hypothetical protein